MSRDKKLSKIKNQVKRLIPGSRVILFGSRARGDGDSRSDYDIMVISDKHLGVKEKRQFAGKIRRELAMMGIPVDVLVKSEMDVSYYRNKIGNLVREAVTTGIAL